MEAVAILVMGLGAIDIVFAAWRSACIACEDDVTLRDRVALSLWAGVQFGAGVVCIGWAAKVAASA